jgi:hypothetical protein
MTGADRLAHAAQRLHELLADARSDLERQYIEDAAADLAQRAEIRLATVTGFGLPLIREGEVT